MTLLELIRAYRYLLRKEGRHSANRYLKDCGTHKVIRDAIESSFA